VVEDEPDAALARDLSGPRHHVFAAVEDDIISAVGSREGRLLLRADGADHLHAGQFGELHDRCSDAAGGPDHQHAIGRVASAAFVQQRPRHLIIC
jgi:hypothetical protein